MKLLIKKMNRFLVILSFILIVLSGYMFYRLKERDGAGNGSVVSDTIYINHIDTFIKEKLVPKNVYVDKIITDTLFSIDSIPVAVNIPISINKFRDTIISKSDTAIISSTISGHHVNYDTLNVVLKLNERVVTNIIKQKNKRFSFGPSVGVQYNGKNIQPYVGFGITYSLWSF